jgi:hypothetical protein
MRKLGDCARALPKTITRLLEALNNVETRHGASLQNQDNDDLVGADDQILIKFEIQIGIRFNHNQIHTVATEEALD